MDVRALERIGLSKGEIAVYLALLRLGQTTAGPIVDESKVTRSKIYDILERLKNKGLVSHIVRSKTKYFSAATPQSIVSFLEQKESEIAKEKHAIEELLPQLMLQQQMAKMNKTAEVYIGYKGMETAFAQVVAAFNSKIPYYAFGAGVGENVKQVQRFFARLQDQRTKAKVKTYIIFNEESRGLFTSQERSSLVERKYLDQKTLTAISVYGDYTIVNILTNEPITLLLKNKEAADSFKSYFDSMWKLASV